MSHPNTGGSRPQTRTQGGQRYMQATTGHVASRSGGGLAAVPASRLEHPPGFDEFGEYDPGDLKEIDKAIRHLPSVVEYARKKAEETISHTGSDNFEVIVSDNPANTRARAYCAPSNNQGIHEELSEHVLLKAAINMAGK
jgi:hypothetical protein